MNIAIDFLKDLRNDLSRIESKIDDLKKNLKQIQTDIKYLRGKSV